MTDVDISSAPARSDNTAKAPALLLLVGLSSVGPLALNIFQPSIDAVARDFSVAASDVQWSLTVYLIGITLGQFFYGPLSDRYGRRPLILIGLIGFILANIWLAVTDSFFDLVIGRGLQAIAGCSGIVLTRAIVRDCYPLERSASALGYITTAMVAVPAVAPTLGYAMESIGSWRYSFWFLAAFAAFVALCTWRFVPETNSNPLRRLTMASYVNGSSSLLTNRAFLGYCGIVGFGTGSFFCFLAGAPYATINVLGGTGKDYSLYFLILSVGYMAGNFVSGRYSTRLGLPLMMRIGFAISIVMMLVFTLNIFAPSMPLLFGPAALIAFGGGLYNPAAMAGALSIRPDIAGTASALIGVLSMGIAVLVSIVTNSALGPSLLGFILPYSTCILAAALCAYMAASANKPTRL